MLSSSPGSATTPVWDIATPSRPSRVPGVSMAGFRDRSTTGVDMLTVPHPALTLGIDLGADPLVVGDGAGREQRGSLVAGLMPGALPVRGAGVECLQVRLSPVVARAALGISPAELDRTVVTLEDVWGRDADRIRDQLRDAPSWEDRFVLADTFLLRRYQEGRPVDPEVARAWDRIVAGQGRVRVDELAAETGWSRKRLWSRFRSQIGLSPKRAARLVRFDRAAHHLAAGRSAARVAAEGGYADQSHLHRDIVTFTGATPSAVAGAPWLAVDDVAWPDRGDRRVPTAG